MEFPTVTPDEIALVAEIGADLETLADVLGAMEFHAAEAADAVAKIEAIPPRALEALLALERPTAGAVAEITERAKAEGAEAALEVAMCRARRGAALVAGWNAGLVPVATMMDLIGSTPEGPLSVLNFAAQVPSAPAHTVLGLRPPMDGPRAVTQEMRAGGPDVARIVDLLLACALEGLPNVQTEWRPGRDHHWARVEVFSPALGYPRTIVEVRSYRGVVGVVPGLS